MHLVIAIPTFNRCEKLKAILSQFDRQIIPKDVEFPLHSPIAHPQTIQSNFLISWIARGQTFLYLISKLIGLVGIMVFEAVLPHDADWIWYMGDDDHFPGTTSLLKCVSFSSSMRLMKNSCSFTHAKLEGHGVQVK